MGFFAHMEKDPNLQKLFYDTARAIDVPVTMNSLYRDMLHDAGIRSAISIPPGVDHERFQPKLRIGVVGRAYHTGRKGEGLVSQLMDMPEIDWHFTGSGWPLPGKYVSEENLPDFYRSMDYILVPALYEGGPMCVPEALATGTPVISSKVGWVPEFPHIPFKNGDADDLRRVLTELLDTKQTLFKSTEAYTWDNFAEQHDRVFNDLLKKAGKKRVNFFSPKPEKARPAIDFTTPVRLLMHGNESTTLGGPSIRVPRTAEALRALGVPAQAGTFADASKIEEGIVHLFNVWSPHSALKALRSLKRAGKFVVFSPIYLDLGEREFWQFQLPNLPMDTPHIIAETYEAARRHQANRGRLPEAVPGYNAMVREMLGLADHVVFLSSAEREALAAIGAEVEDDRCSLVKNPVDTDIWREGDPGLFRETFLKSAARNSDYIVCVGRIEPRKNQLLLARAIRDLPVTLVLIGHAGDPEYAEKVRREGGNKLIMAGRMEPGSDLLRSALSGARAFALPSWSEGASLAALEAAASGATLILSNRSSETEYFGDLAKYCDPGDPDSIRAAIVSTLTSRPQNDRKRRLRDLVVEHNSWERYALDTARAYATAQKAPPRAQPPVATDAHRVAPKLVFDITTLAHHQGRITGISRVESKLAEEFEALGEDLAFICWNDSLQKFIEVPSRYARFGHAAKFCKHISQSSDIEAVILPEDCTVVVPGSAWMQNSRYVRGLEDLKSRCNCSLYSIIYDLVPFKFPFWFDKHYAPVFRDNFFRLASFSDHILTDSESCAADVRTVLNAESLPVPSITPIRLGDPKLIADHGISAEELPRAIRQSFEGKKFVLSVGAIHARKNYEMLYRVWARFADEGIHSDLHLVIIGGVAWNGQVLSSQISSDSRVAGNIHILSGIEDDDLGWFYENCLFTAFPSHYEGWGLPVAESLVHGKLCLATSSSSVTEIAPQVVEHIDPEDFAVWHQKISFFASSRAAREAKEAAIREGYTAVPWKTTAHQILELVKAPRALRQCRALYAGEVASASNQSAPLTLSFQCGWHPAEGWGRWTSARRASLRINAAQALRPQQEELSLLIKQQSYFQDGEAKPLKIWVGGKLKFASTVNAENFPRELLLKVLAADIDEKGMLQVDVDFPMSAESPAKEPQRACGLGLISLALLDAEFSNPLQSLTNSAHWFEGTEAAHIDMRRETHRKVSAPHLDYSPAWGAGSTKGGVDLLVPILPSAPTQEVSVSYRPAASPKYPLSLRVLWNGEEVARAHTRHDGQSRITFDVPRKLLTKSSPAVLTLESNSLLSPKEVDLGVTHQIAGIGVSDIFLKPKGA